ncbi:MAG: PDZ domain-containing protein [Nitriliruptoraceae bacterium]
MSRVVSPRSFFYSASVGIVAWAAMIVPLPFLEYIPGRPTEVPPLIALESADVTELDGTTALLTVSLRQQSTLGALMAAVDADRSLYRLEQIYPPDLDRDEYRQLQRERFSRQFEIAAAVGARAAGIPTELVTEVVVVDVVDNGASSGLLTPGDVVVTVDGMPVTAAEELQQAVLQRQVGDTVDLEIVRDGQSIRRVVTLGSLAGQDGPRLGVAIQTAVDELRLPFKITLAEPTRIGGPSAGLIVGVTVYDLLASEDLLRGRTVAATGSLDADGSVGHVGGVPEKMRAAAAFGADVVLVPYGQADIAKQAAPGVNIIGVRNLDEAINALRTH